MTKPLEAPEILAYELSGNTADSSGQHPAVYLSACPPPYRADSADTPDNRHPKWLANKIENSRRKAKPRTCRCGANILVGDDDDSHALTARVDPTPVDRVREVAALLAGRASYDLDRGNLYHRDLEHHLSANRPHPVLLEHTCPPEANPCLF